MTIYRLTPERGAPVLRQARNLKGATMGGLREFPAGLRSVEPVDLPELAVLASAGVPLPVAARQALKVYQAVQREKAKADARVEAMRQKAREKVNAKREEERAQRAALREQEKAARAAEKKRKEAAARRAQKKAQRLQQAPREVDAGAVRAAPAVALMVDATDTRLPWED